MDSNTAYQNYLGSMNKYLSMNPTTSQEITQNLMGKIGNLKPQYTELGNAQTSAAAAPAEVMAKYNIDFGGNNGPDQFTRIGNAINEIGNRQTTATALGNSINAEQGRVGDLANSTLDAYNQSRNALGTAAGNNLSLYNNVLGSETSRANAQTAAAAQEYAASLNNRLGISQLVNSVNAQLAAKGLKGVFDDNGNLTGYTDLNGNPTGPNGSITTPAPDVGGGTKIGGGITYTPQTKPFDPNTVNPSTFNPAAINNMISAYR